LRSSPLTKLEIAREIVATDKATHDMLLGAFPCCFVDDELNRCCLKELIATDKNERARLDSIMHPLIFDKLKSQIDKSNSEVIVVEIPLLFEAGFESLCDFVVCAMCDSSTQLKRLMARDGLAIGFAIKLAGAQMDLSKKANKSCYIINTDTSFVDLKRAVNKTLTQIKQKA